MNIILYFTILANYARLGGHSKYFKYISCLHNSAKSYDERNIMLVKYIYIYVCFLRNQNEYSSLYKERTITFSCYYYTIK